ncbi:STAS domain-containing protein [Caldibacillus lycopersici]|uniref:STAS domain-containing protein n=1 Tax=Perspicuibacillus lycopersici TaxID=1325689 RepID=A0AAE3IVB1_9BACI|nr:STAS domain-containing protein [Perspicuibacillus lycopersici]MCU9613544.1 STAS domain-containing protein [Perspicuibacillus lycopersici]
MEVNTNSTDKLKKYFQINSEKFEETLLSEAINVRDKIDEILRIGNIDLVNNAHKLIGYIIEGLDQELLAFAKQEGIAWATHSIPLSFKLEWIHAIRRTLWDLIKNFDELTEKNIKEEFFRLEKQINTRVDVFLNAFFINYSTYKDTLITKQKELVENLSVPIIPINPSICILPLIGSMDSFRVEIIEEKVLSEIGKLRIDTLIMDLSGIADMEEDVIFGLMKIIDSISLMGCKVVITGFRKDLVKNITKLGIKFSPQTHTLGTLQQALHTYLLPGFAYSSLSSK